MRYSMATIQYTINTSSTCWNCVKTWITNSNTVIQMKMLLYGLKTWHHTVYITKNIDLQNGDVVDDKTGIKTS